MRFKRSRRAVDGFAAPRAALRMEWTSWIGNAGGADAGRGFSMLAQAE